MSATKQTSDSLAVTGILAASGGFMGAYTHICRGKVFSSAQTGNLLHLGINLAAGDMAAAATRFFPLVFFVLGIMVADTIRCRAQAAGWRLHWRQVTLLLGAAILVSVAFAPHSMDILATSLASMVWGCQLETFIKVREYGVADTMMIGNLKSATHSLCDFALKGRREGLREWVTMMSIVLLFLLGAVLGGRVCGIWQERAILMSSGLHVICFTLMFIEGHD